MFISIKYKIFAAQFILVVLLSSWLSYSLYSVQVNTYTKSLVSFYENSSSWIVNRVSLAISGNNYANVQVNDFVKYISRNNALLFFKAYGKTDNSQEYYEIIYDKSLQKVYRTDYKESHAQEIEEKIERFESLLKMQKEDKVKIAFLINRLHDAKKEYETSKEHITKADKKYLELLKHDDIFFDYKNNLLVLQLKTSNINGGFIKLIFDISHIKSIRDETIKNIAIEVFFVLVFSILFLWLVSSKIITPLKNLTHIMLQDFQTIDAKEIPCNTHHDEIGQLAKSFQIMLTQMNSYISRLEQLSKNDPLTGLYNRRAFDEIFADSLKKNRAKYIGLLYMDIDYFKPYNDNYGHNQGDVTLQMVSKSITTSLHRKSDNAFRLGGEEFAVMVSVDTKEDALEIAERIRKNIIELKIEHLYSGVSDVVTMSIGVFITPNSDNLELIELLHRADEALYGAKAGGRNRVVINEDE